MRLVSSPSASAHADVSLLHRLEVDLHHDVVLRCKNEELRATLYRCQLPLITVHLSFGSYGEDPRKIGIDLAEALLARIPSYGELYADRMGRKLWHLELVPGQSDDMLVGPPIARAPSAP